MSDKIIAVVISDASLENSQISIKQGTFGTFGGTALILFPDFPEKNDVVYLTGQKTASEATKQKKGGSAAAEKDTMQKGIERAFSLGATHIIAICDMENIYFNSHKINFFSKKEIEKLEGEEFKAFIQNKVRICHHLANAERVLKQYNLKRG